MIRSSSLLPNVFCRRSTALSHRTFGRKARALITLTVLFVASSRSTQGYLATTFHIIEGGKLSHGLLSLRQVVKGDDGHTAERIAEELRLVFRECVRLVQLDEAEAKLESLLPRVEDCDDDDDDDEVDNRADARRLRARIDLLSDPKLGVADVAVLKQADEVIKSIKIVTDGTQLRER